MWEQLRREYERAKTEGWISTFISAAETHQLKPEILMAIASRETNMGGRRLPTGGYEWLERIGDAGHGYGLMQVDGRSFPEWTSTKIWKDAKSGIEKGAQILARKRDSFVQRQGKECKVRERRNPNKVYKFTMPVMDGDILLRAAIAAYNSGDWAAYHLSKDRSVDHGTTGKNYSSDVLERAAIFHQLLEDDGWLEKKEIQDVGPERP